MKASSNKEGNVKKPRLGVIAKKNRTNIKLLIPYIPFILIILAYLTAFFILRGKILFTPDFDRSDAFHLNVSLKYYLWQTLHNNSLPFWTQKLQGGFPLIAEGQIGAIYLLNLFAYRIFSFPDAYMISFIGSLFLFTVSFFMLLRRQGIKTVVSLLISFSAAFSGFITYRWVHMNVIQTVALYPLLFLSAERAYYGAGWRDKLIYAFIVAQLIFAGHIQMAFIGLLSQLVYLAIVEAVRIKDYEKIIRRLIFGAIPPLLLGCLLALPQLAPTILLMKYSNRTFASGYNFATSYSFPISHLLSFISPYIYGNPKYGSYPLLLQQWGVFWENTPAIGEVISVIFLFSVLYVVIQKKRGANRGIPCFIVSGVFFLLALGSNSPLYFLFDLPPFSMFRTPAKYLIPSALFLIWGCAHYVNIFISEMKSDFVKVITYSALLCNILILILTAFSYHVFIDSKILLSPTAVTVPLKNSDRYLTYGFSPIWGRYFAANGWAKPSDISAYMSLNSLLIPESNLIYGGECFDINTGGLHLRRVDTINTMLANFFTASASAQIATASAMNLLSIAGVNSFIATAPLDGLETQGFKKTIDNHGFYHYMSNTKNTGYYLPHRTNQALYTEDFQNLYDDNKLSTQEAMVEGIASAYYGGKSIVYFTESSDEHFKISLSADKETFLVIAKNWYPEWRVTLDGKVVQPIKTNLLHMGIIVPAGRHTISADYVPYAFYWGLVAATVALAGTLVTIRIRGWKWIS